MVLDQKPQGSISTSAYIVRPQNVCFEAQREHESLYLLLRRHQITNVPWILVGVLMLLAPLVVASLIGDQIFDFLAQTSRFLPLAVLLFWYVLSSAYIFQRFLLWYFSAYIVTDERVVDFDFRGLFIREFSEAQLERIQDVTSEVVGPLALMFNYGQVKVQTAAEQSNIEFENVPHPDQVTRLLGQLVVEKGGSLSVRDN